MSEEFVNTTESLEAASGSMEDFAEAADLVGLVARAETNGEALGAILKYRQKVRMDALASCAAPAAAQLDAELPPLPGEVQLRQTLKEIPLCYPWGTGRKLVREGSSLEWVSQRESTGSNTQLADMNKNLVNSAIAATVAVMSSHVAPYAERIRLLEREKVDMEARKDAAYLERNQVVAALAKCFPSGVARTAIEGWSEYWHGCVYIDLPTGQASWHFHDSQAYLFDGLPPYAGKWDGHTTEEKYKRIAYIDGRTAAPTHELRQAAQALIAAFDDPKCSIASVNNYVRDLECALGRTAGTAPEAWRPIKTAPTNMARHLYLVDGFCVQGFVDATGELMVQSEVSPHWRKMRGKPTHWMPIPAAPSPQENTKP